MNSIFFFLNNDKRIVFQFTFDERIGYFILIIWCCVCDLKSYNMPGY